MWEFFDPYILPLYGITGTIWLDGLLGTFLVALLACTVGEFTISMALRVNRGHLDRIDKDLKKYSDLSRKALESGDGASYKALNKEANDAYGQVFFNRFGLSAAMLWPAFFALDWTQRHFLQSGIRVPFSDSGVNYLLVFILCYVLARMVLGRLKRHLPRLRAIRNTSGI